MRLRDVGLGDEDAYVRMRCDPVMMAELGGPLPRAGIAAKLRADIEIAASGVGWIKMIVPDETLPEVAAGYVTMWSDHGQSEIGWMVLPEFQGRGLGKLAVRTLLADARADGRWGRVHAYPGTTNGPSNGICRALGFQFVEETEVEFTGRLLHVNHWIVDTTTSPG